MKLSLKHLTAGLALSPLLACATIAPPQLLEAREEYTTATNGLAGQLTPTDLYEAKKSLDKADAQLDAFGNMQVLLDYTYIAMRKIELANVKARTELDRQRIAEATKEGLVVRDRQAAVAQVQLADTRDELTTERSTSSMTNSALRATNSAQGKELRKSENQLVDERAANTTATTELKAENDQQGRELALEKKGREAAETRLASAMKALATVAAVKQEPRGVVITLSGSVLFGSGKSGLLDTAKVKLDQVAEALKAQGDDKKIVIEGHTDGQGTDATNQPLSLSRATAVRDYLITRGIDAGRITAAGLGSTQPLLPNTNAENRANNRRVEIVIQPTKLSAR